MKRFKNIRTAIAAVSAFIFAVIFAGMQSCTNPFAPGMADENAGGAVLGDQTTIEGLFKNFRYAYIFKDTLVYGNLLHDDFTFIYRDYNQGVDKSWGRNEDLIATNGIFNNTQSLDLIWNEVLISIGDSVLKDISRGFTLTLVFNPSDQIRVQGRANFRITRPTASDEWKIIRWRDESNY